MGKQALGVVQIASAAGADLDVGLHHVAALRALAGGLVALVSPQQRCDRPEERQAEADQEPEHERGALDLPDRARRQAEEEQDHEQLHGCPGSEDSESPDDRDDRQHDHGDPGHGGHEAEHDLEQHVGRHRENPDGQQLAAGLRSELTHAAKVSWLTQSNWDGLVGR